MESPKKINAFTLTNAFLKAGGKVLGVAARAGGNVLKNANDAQHLEQTLNIIEPMIFVGGGRLIQGMNRPAYVVALVGPDLEKFKHVCKKLLGRGIQLPPHVATFVRIKNIPL
ncbi:MAG: hypothetical protein Q7S75_03655 [bacterium]|nr:hypothetical protein [bacterium]